MTVSNTMCVQLLFIHFFVTLVLLLNENDEMNIKNSRFISSLQKSIDLRIEKRNNISRSQMSSFLSVKEMGEEIIGMEPTIEYVLHWILKPVLATILKMLDLYEAHQLGEFYFVISIFEQRRFQESLVENRKNI